MVLSLFRMRSADPYLNSLIQTERFDLVSKNYVDTLKLTLPWASDPETLHAHMYERKSYTKLQWALRLMKPDGRNNFSHAIVHRDTQQTIGAHQTMLTRSGSASMAISLSDKSWAGKGVFEEVRVGVMDHFCQSPRLVRFFGRALSRNFSSIYNYKKIGFRLIGHDQKSWKSPLTEELHDTMFFEFMADEWREKRGLQVL